MMNSGFYPTGSYTMIDVKHGIRFLWLLVGRNTGEMLAIPFLLLAIIIVAPIVWISNCWEKSNER